MAVWPPALVSDESALEAISRGIQGILGEMSYYSFYRPTEGRRLSQPSWQASHQDGLPARRQSPITVLTGPGVE